ncbi:MAG: RadC family protein [Ruminococcus sp.]|nr:RadC family protein [Ruminococcus sp.]
MQKADHSGHRVRMKKKLAEHGLDAFEPHEVLEILLYYAIPQRNTNDIAKNLIDRYGSFSAVLDAPLDSLIKFGLTEHQALYLKMIPDVTRLYMLDKYHNADKVLDSENIARYIIDKFIGYEEKEHVLLILMDKKGKEVYSGMIARGDFHSANISVREIVTLALNYGAVSAILAHSHPSGYAMPSREDVMVTRDLKKALALVKVELVDHFIVADHDCVSLAESELI